MQTARRRYDRVVQRVGIAHALAVAFVAIGTSSCGTPDAFQCAVDGQCDGGVCAEGGFCAFPDDDCASGIRYGGLAGDGLAGTCTPAPAGTDGGQPAGSTGDEPDLDDSSSGDPSTTLAADDSSGDEAGSTGTAVSCTEWWDSDWPSRRLLTVDASALSQTLSAFPATIRLGTDVPLLANGADVRFVTEDCTVLPHELETSQRGVAMLAWFRLPTVGPDTPPIYVYYGNASAPNLGNDAAVWDDDFTGVWHLGTLGDSTTQTNDPLEPPLMPIADAPLGEGALFDGIDDMAQAAASPALSLTDASGVSVSGWIRLDGVRTPGTQRIVDKADSTNATAGFSVNAVWLPDEPVEIEFDRGFDLGEYAARTVDVPVELGVWHHLGVVHDDESLTTTFVFDGAVVESVVTNAGEGVILPDDEYPVTLGTAAYAASRFLAGGLDDVRVSKIERPVDWIIAEYLASTDALVVIGAGQSAP